MKRSNRVTNMLLVLSVIMMLYMAIESYLLSNRLDNVLTIVQRQDKQIDNLLNLIDDLQTIEQKSDKVPNNDDPDTTNIPNG